MDPRSPGGQGLTRTPIILKEDLDEEKSTGKKVIDKETTESSIPTRGSAAFVDKLTETAKMEVTFKNLTVKYF